MCGEDKPHILFPADLSGFNFPIFNYFFDE